MGWSDRSARLPARVTGASHATSTIVRAGRIWHRDESALTSTELEGAGVPRFGALEELF